MLELNLTDQVALVTGGSEGVGKAIATKLAEEGCRVAVCARRLDVLNATAAHIHQVTGKNILVVPADVTKQEDIEHFVTTSVAKYGHVDILVNNAGKAAGYAFEIATEKIWQEDFSLKFWAAVRTARLTIPYMKKRGHGSIVNITHPGGKAPGNHSVPTSVSRAAGIALTKAMSKDLASHHIRVNTVCLDNIHSAQLQRQWRALGTSQTYKQWSVEQGSQVPLGRLGHASEVADLVAFLVSQRADFITGTAINIDGGIAANV